MNTCRYIKRKRERERERERDIKRKRERTREKDRERERDTKKESEREREGRYHICSNIKFIKNRFFFLFAITDGKKNRAVKLQALFQHCS